MLAQTNVKWSHIDICLFKAFFFFFFEVCDCYGVCKDVSIS